MANGIEGWLSAVLTRWVLGVRHRARSVLVVCAVLTVLFAAYSALELRYNSDTVAMVGDIPSRRILDEYAALFPNLENAILVVIDAETPELARDAAEGLTDALRVRSAEFEEVYLPGGGEFFETYGLLYASADELEGFADEIATLQPVIAELERDGSIANMASLVVRSLDAAEESGNDERWADVLDRVGSATIKVFQEYPVAVSWEELLLAGSSLDVATRRVLILHPILDFGDMLAAGAPRARILEEASRLGFDAEHGVRVRVTGNPVLNYEELIGFAWDLGVGGVLCFLVVAGILYGAFRAWTLVVATIATLLVGLVWTTAWATATVGHLQIISMSAGILYIGLGVDFGIHLGASYAERRGAGDADADAWRAAIERVGSSLLLCALTTAIGFFVFVPTQYTGVAELGWIAGGGMFVIVFLTFTLFPALLSGPLALSQSVASPPGFERSPLAFFERHAGAVRAASLIAGVAAIALLPGARFDPNAVRMRDDSTPSVQAFEDLLAESGASSPWAINVVAPDLAGARALAEELAKLPTVSQALTLADYVPDNQEEKIEILAEIEMMLESPSAAGMPPPDRLEIDEQIAALRRLHDKLAPAEGASPHPLAASMARLRDRIGEFLDRVEREGKAPEALARFETLLLAGFPAQLQRLRRALSVSPIDGSDLPPDLVSRMLAADGQARVQVFPRETLLREEDFTGFVDEVRGVAPRATGVAVNLLEFGRTTQQAFRQALLSALVLIALLLLLLWRRVSDVVLVLGPLLLGAAWVGAVMVLLDIPFNYTNVIVIPLLFGIGIDSGIHMVHRSLHVEERASDVLRTTTARAIYYSAVTTTASFGTLALSGHTGMASLGILLSVGMLFTVIANLIVLPAWIAWVVARRSRAAA